MGKRFIVADLDANLFRTDFTSCPELMLEFGIAASKQYKLHSIIQQCRNALE